MANLGATPMKRTNETESEITGLVANINRLPAEQRAHLGDHILRHHGHKLAAIPRAIIRAERLRDGGKMDRGLACACLQVGLGL